MKPIYIVALIALLFAPLAAQPVDIPDAGNIAVASEGGPGTADPTTTPVEWYATKGGILAMTIFLVSILKRALGGVQGINSIPTWLFSVVVAGALTYLAVAVWGTMPGELWQTLSEVVMNAAAASGIYEWINHGSKSLKASSLGVKTAT